MAVTLNFIADLSLYDTEKPFAFNFNPGPDIPLDAQSNLRYEEHPDIKLQDVRSLPQGELTYESHGFRFLNHPSTSPLTFTRGEDEVQQYCTSMAGFVLQEFGAEKAICYDFRVSPSMQSASYVHTIDPVRLVATASRLPSTRLVQISQEHL
jgi:hypothetical protein